MGGWGAGVRACKEEGTGIAELTAEVPEVP